MTGARAGPVATAATRSGAYRDDINGLRAIAVLGVVLYHLGAPLLPGGYAGVDVFFVISGFLMTAIIVGRLEAGRFGVLAFYEARARRIVPALVGLCGALLAVGACAVDPDTVAATARAVVSSLLFASNIQYYSEAGYFDLASTAKWLLHTWSLSLEWQFYLAYPLVLAAAWRARPSRVALGTVVALVGAASLALCLIALRYRPSAAFFLLPMRAWEMAAGGMVAIAPIRRPTERTGRALQVAGLLAILLAMLAFDAFTPWPSLRTLLPVLGTCLVILADRRASRLTGNPVLRPIGLWSYAIYLWHWPLIVGGRYFAGESSVATKLGLLAVAMVCGGAARTALSRLPVAGRGVPGAARAMFALTLALALVVVATGGLEGRRPAMRAELARLRAAKDDWAYPKHCRRTDARGVPTACTIPGARPGRVLFIGDSEAQALYGRWAAREAGPAGDHATLSFITYGGCPTLPGVDRRELGYRCASYLDRALAVAEAGPFGRVVFTSLWAGYFTLGAQSVCFPLPGHCPAATGEGLREATAEAVSRLEPHVRRLRAGGTEVMILLTIPHSRYDVPRELAKRLYLDRTTADVTAIDRAAFLAADELARGPLRALAARTGATIVDPVPFLCGPASCPTGDEATPSFYRDSVHVRATVMRSDRFGFLDALARLPEPVPGEGRWGAQSRLAPQ